VHDEIVMGLSGLASTGTRLALKAAGRKACEREVTVAQRQPEREPQDAPISNVVFDLVTELSNCGQAIDALDLYIDDANQESNPEAARVFEQIREDELRHCEMLRNAIRELVRQNKF
jgi:hypothetical protein